MIQTPLAFACSSATCLRAAATSSSLVFALLLSPQPPGAASVRSTQVRSASAGSWAASATMLANWLDDRESLGSIDSAPVLVSTWTCR